MSKLHIKLTAFTTHLSLKVLDFSQVLSVPFRSLSRLEVLIISLRRFCHASVFPGKILNKLASGHIWLCAPGFERCLRSKICKRFSCEHLDVHLFPSTLHTKLYNWEKSSIVKYKCAVKAVNFKCHLLTDPLIKMIFKGQGVEVRNYWYRTYTYHYYRYNDTTEVVVELTDIFL